MKVLLLIFLFAATLNAVPSVLDRNQVLKDVNNLDMTGGCYGPLYLADKNSFSIVRNINDVFFAGTVYGAGHVVAIGHSAPLSSSFLTVQDNGVFSANLFKWMTNGKTSIKILNFMNALSSDYATVLSRYGINATTTKQTTLDNLNNYDVIAFPSFKTYPTQITDSQVQDLVNYVKNGGSIYLGSSAWVWFSYGEGSNPEKSLYSDFFPNKLYSNFGVLFLDGCTTLKVLPILTIDPKINEIRVKAFLQNFAGKIKSNASLTDGELTEGNTVNEILQSDQWLNLDNVFAGSDFSYYIFLQSYAASKYLPYPQTTLMGTDLTANLLYSLLKTISNILPPEKVLALPDATLWPGTTNSTRRESRNVTLPTERTKFVCTGLYANAGEVVTINLDNIDHLVYGIEVLVGTGDDLTNKPDKKRKRFPKVNTRYPLMSSKLVLSSPHGGMIYIYLKNQIPANKTVVVSICNGVPAPYFNEDVHTDLEWFTTIRNNPAPWFNLECRGLIFILKVTPYIQSMTKVKAVCEWWDQVYQGYPYLSGDIRAYKEVIMGDIEIGAGYMHSGMPIMTYLDVVDFSMGKADEIYTKCSWGHFHEIGHNYQVSDWTFSGTGEVTNNIWSLYGGYKMCGFKPLENPWFGNITKKIVSFFSAPSYETWTSNPGTALVMYAQIADTFSFEVFRKVFLEYRTLEGKERPQNEDEKRDQWLVRLSRATGKNLGPFFTKWTVPTSQSARDSISDLPIWMPEGLN